MTEDAIKINFWINILDLSLNYITLAPDLIKTEMPVKSSIYAYILGRRKKNNKFIIKF